MWNERKKEKKKNSVLICPSTSVVVTKTIQGGKGSLQLILPGTVQLQGNSRRNSSQELGAEIIKEGCLLAGWLLLLWFVFSQTRSGTAHSGLNPSTPSTTRTIPQRHGHRPMWSETPSSEMTLRCVIEMNTNQGHTGSICCSRRCEGFNQERQ